MRWRKAGVGFACLVLFVSLFFPITVQGKRGTKLDPNRLLAQMTLEEKVGQMMMVGFYGNQPTDEIERLIKEGNAGSVILFAYSDNVQTPQQTARLNNGLQRLASETRLGLPLLIATDQEGGVVARLTTGATELPGNMALGATRKMALASKAARLTGDELRAVGINMNLAPTLDVNVNPENPVIGVRSYGEDQRLVAEMGAVTIKGLQKNVVATAKHFPGHGDTNVDSHLGLPIIDKSRQELEQVELPPFKRAIDAGVDAIMTAHIHVPALDATPNLPATLSKPILTDLLRKEMGYQGIIITDAMTMAGVADYFGGVSQAAVKAVDAGADIILLTPELTTEQQLEVYQDVLAAVRSGEISEKRINQSVKRILEVKLKYRLFQEREVDVKKVAKRVGTRKNKKQALEIARSSITLVQNKGGLLPLRKRSSEKIGVISHYSLQEFIQPYHKRTTEYVYDHVQPSDQQIEEAVSMARSKDVLIVGTYSSSLYPQQKKLVQELQALGKPMVVIALRNPYDLVDFPEVDAYLATYGFRTVSLQAAVETVFGVNSPRGRLPVTIPDLYPIGHGLSYR